MGNTNRDAKWLLAAANRVGTELARKCWTAQQREWVLSASATVDYAVPSDFRHFINGTGWNRTDADILVGPLTPQDWQLQKSGLVQSVTDDFYRVTLRRSDNTRVVTFDSSAASAGASSAVETRVFEYVSDAWVWASASAEYKVSFEADTDKTVFPDDLFELGVIWRYKKAFGLEYAEDRMEYERQLDISFSQDGGAQIVRFGTRAIDPNNPNIPETGFGS